VVATQSTAQLCALHARVSALCAHAVPPLLGAVVARERLWLPPPHDLVHVLHACHMFCTQSVTHAFGLHSRVSARYGHT
jgi:hypothetical protein